MKKLFLLFLIFFSCTTFVSANNYLQMKVQGHLVKIIKYDRFDDRYNFKVAVNADYHATGLRELMERYNAISGVNGVFLCPADYHECGGKNFTHNERYVMGQKIARDPAMWDRAMFAWDEEGKAFLYNDERINPDKESEIYYGLANHPLILQNGESALDYYEDAGLIGGKMKTSGTRNFICTDKTRRYMMTGFVYGATMYEMPDILKNLGCYDALNLDAGYTSAMIYNGKTLIKEGRPMLDAVVVERKWLDVVEQNTMIDTVIASYKEKMQSVSAQEKLTTTEAILAKIADMRHTMYEQNSTDFYDEFGEYIGYEIHMNDLDDVTMMYILNMLENRLWTIQWEFKQELKYEENKKNGLFL